MNVGLRLEKTDYRMRLDKLEVSHSARIAVAIKSITTAIPGLGDVAVVRRALDDQDTG
jgi:hypothetical protein